MGFGTRNNGQIKTFWPDDTETEMYITESASLADIVGRCVQKWPGFLFSDITIESKFIHTDCITYDLMDWGDYTNFLCITYNKKD